MKRFPAYYRPVAVDAGNAIDWEHPDNRGLVFLMGGYPGTQSAGGVVPNLVSSIPANLSLKTTAKWANAVPGIGGVFCSALNDGAEISTPTRIRLTLPITIAVSVRSYGVPTGSSGIFGIVPNNTNGSPFVSSAIGVDAGGNINYGTNSAGTFGAVVTSRLLSSLTSPSRIAVVHTSASISVYINGVLSTSSVSSRSDPTYAATSLLYAGSYTGVSRNVNATIWGGRIQNFAADSNWVVRDYLAHLNPWSDDRLRWFSTRSYSTGVTIVNGFGTTVGAATAAGVGASSVSAVGSSAGASTLVGSGASSYSATGSSTGASGSSGAGASFVSAIASATGLSTLAGIGRSIINAIGAIFGTSTATGISSNTSQQGILPAIIIRGGNTRCVRDAVTMRSVRGSTPTRKI